VKCATETCNRTAEPGYGNCVSDTNRLLRAFGPRPVERARVERLSDRDPFCKSVADEKRGARA
jgi:hypothetical protein